MSILRKLYLHSETVKAVCFIIMIMIILVSGITMFNGFTSEASDISINDDYHKKAERQFVADIKEELQSMGYRNCAVTLLKEFDGVSTLDYKLVIHHRLLEDNMDNRDSVTEMISSERFKLSDTPVKVEFFEG
ncbi:MAG: hypothetical protein K5662_02995 [Lachnospiraceae bacterium]|nr:hypothetical protein [Lachnospiraceae bacterium]